MEDGEIKGALGPAGYESFVHYQTVSPITICGTSLPTHSYGSMLSWLDLARMSRLIVISIVLKCIFYEPYVLTNPQHFSGPCLLGITQAYPGDRDQLLSWPVPFGHITN